MLKMISKNLLSIVLLLSLLSSIRGDDSVQVIKYTMPLWMRVRATYLIQNCFDNQMELSKIATNLTTDFNTNYGSEWFCIIGPIGYVAHFNYEENTLLWMSINEIEIILFKPMQVLNLHKIS